MFIDLSRWGWLFLERKWILSGIQFTRHFIEFVVVETKQLVSSNLNVIVTRKTCGQRSSMCAGRRKPCGKGQALGNYSFMRIWYMFPLSKCRGDLDLGLCTFWVHAFGVLIRWPINRSNRFSNFLRLDRLDRFGKIIKSIFSKFWKREF